LTEEVGNQSLHPVAPKIFGHSEKPTLGEWNRTFLGPGKPTYFFGQFPLVSAAETASFGKLS
jgi:hypothetical protein